MAQVRIRIFPHELTEMLVDSNSAFARNIQGCPKVEVWDASEGTIIPLTTLEEGDYLEVVFE